MTQQQRQPLDHCGICGFQLYPKYRCLCESHRNGGVRTEVAEAGRKAIEKYDGALRNLRERGDSMTKVKIRKLYEDAVIPTYAHDEDAGFDLYALEDTVIEPGATQLIKTGIAMAIPKGYEVQIRPRSGVTLRTKLRVQLGTIDSGYNGDIGVIVDNIRTNIGKLSNRIYNVSGNTEEVDSWTAHHKRYGEYTEYDEKAFGTYIIRKGDRIAQAVLAPVSQASFVEVDTLNESDRGEGGFGSSGTSYEQFHAKQAEIYKGIGKIMEDDPKGDSLE